jgi:DNA-binding NarL/FixJ family response regulator
MGKSMKKIMIVEDEAVIALRLEQQLIEMGYDVIGISHTGEAAVENARSLPPDLILMDIMIPGDLDGIDVAKIVREELDIPVIFMTAFSEDEFIERAKEAEPYGYLVKPIRDRELRATVKIALYKKKLDEALKKSHDELEHRVEERTIELETALKGIALSEKELNQRKLALEEVNRQLLETNQALSILARNIDKDKELLEKKIYEITSTNMMPIIKELQDDKSCQKRLADLELLKTYLNGLIPGPTDQHEIIVRLSSQEIRVAVMIKRGLTSPIIADMLNVSLHTVKTHRKNIRKKLKLQNSNVNLTSYLRSKFRE